MAPMKNQMRLTSGNYLDNVIFASEHPQVNLRVKNGAP